MSYTTQPSEAEWLAEQKFNRKWEEKEKSINKAKQEKPEEYKEYLRLKAIFEH